MICSALVRLLAASRRPALSNCRWRLPTADQREWGNAKVRIIPCFDTDDECGGKICQTRPYSVGNFEMIDYIDDGCGIGTIWPVSSEVTGDRQSYGGREGN